MSRKRILLIKEPRHTVASEQDPYAEVFNATAYDVDFLPALAHRLCNSERLSQIIRDGSHERYSGIVITSQRAVAAWASAGNATEVGSGWTALPIYVVGPATAKCLSTLSPRLAPPSTLVVGGQESGNAEKLASFICANHCSPLPLLCLVGDKRKDTLSTVLLENRIQLSEVQVYETYTSPTIQLDFLALSGRFDWVVFFSPSGVKVLLPVVHKLGINIKIAAIGPTTREYIEEISQTTVTAMAKDPSPEALLLALREIDGMFACLLLHFSLADRPFFPVHLRQRFRIIAVSREFSSSSLACLLSRV